MKIYSLLNFLIVGFLFHLGFSAFFITFSLIGIEYSYSPSYQIVNCSSCELKNNSFLQNKTKSFLLANLHENSSLLLSKPLDNFLSSNFVQVLQKLLKSSFLLTQAKLLNKVFLRGPPLK